MLPSFPLLVFKVHVPEKNDLFLVKWRIWYLTEICLEICEMQRWWDLWGHRCGVFLGECGSSDN